MEKLEKENEPMVRYKGLIIRPPSEARSLILQVTYGCSHNACTFCATYKGCAFQLRDLEEIREDIAIAKRLYPRTNRVFLADGNALCRSTDELMEILFMLNKSFPALERVGTYANAQDLLEKSEAELKALSDSKLAIFYLGLESGDDETLKKVRKGVTAEEMVRAVRKGKEAGMRSSIMVLLGLGGVENSKIHALRTAEILSEMEPEYISALTLMVIPGTKLHREMEMGEFSLPDQLGLLRELRHMVENINVRSSLFRSNHASNYLPLGGVLSRDRQAIIDAIDYALKKPEILRPEFMRGL